MRKNILKCLIIIFLFILLCLMFVRLLDINKEEFEIPQLKSNIDEIKVELKNNLIPIVYDEKEEHWIVTDENNGWYDYDKKKWANAISVTSMQKEKYIPGKVVKEKDVLGYFVYIPRYKYKLFNVSNNQTKEQVIEIVFETKESSKAKGTTDNSWLTHPAFTYGNQELSGIWVSKYELTGSIELPTSKPNEKALGSGTIKSTYELSLKFNEEKTYGLHNPNAHMIKNIEWGAMAYLSHSKYGNNNIKMNSSNFITAAGDYKKNIDMSTTGNIYGIYDTSGTSFEYVMGVVENEVGMSEIDFNTLNINNYDKYTSSNFSTDYSRKKLGDATSETRGWYNNYQSFITKGLPWFIRGGIYYEKKNSGIFAFSVESGRVNHNMSTRVVLSSY